MLAFLEREVDGRVPAFVCVFGRGSSEAFIEQARGILAGRYPRARVRRATWGSYVRQGAWTGSGVGAGVGATAGVVAGAATVPLFAVVLAPLWALEGALWGAGFS